MDYVSRPVTKEASLSEYKTLLKDSQRHQAFINRIKNKVAENHDNLTNPVPLFTQLNSSTGSREVY